MGKILITGATGHLGKATIDFLLKRGIILDEISALVRDAGKAKDLKGKGINLVIGDYSDYNSLVEAFTGVEKLFFISSNDVLNRTLHHENVIKAALQADVKHIIYTGVLSNVPIEKSAIAPVTEAHKKTEEQLVASGLSYTLLRNNLYMDLVPQFIGEKVLDTEMVFFPAGNGKVAFVLRSEIAEAAANLLSTQGHEGKTYNITNVEAYSYQQLADYISEITGKNIKYVSPAPEEFSEVLKNAGAPENMIGAFTAFALAQAQDEFNVTGNDFVGLLGREPKNLKEYLTEIYANK